MKNRKLFLKILIVFLAVGIASGVYVQVHAQQNVVGYLEMRLRQQKVPVAGIKIIQDFPLQIEITIRSRSNGKKGVPEDPIILQMLEREIILARQEGYFIDRFTRITVDEKGKQIAKSDSRVKIFEHILLDTSSSKVPDNVTLNEVEKAISLNGLSVTRMDISSENGMQSLILELSVPSINKANLSLPSFMGSLRPLIEGINAQGSHIVVCKLELKDANGNMLLSYILDLQMHSERWWMDENITQDWFSVPAPAP